LDFRGPTSKREREGERRGRKRRGGEGKMEAYF